MSETQPPAPSSESTSAGKGALGILFLIVFTDLLGFGIIIPLLPRYVPEYQQNPLEVTLLFSVFSICQFVAAPILGLMSDRFGRKPVLAISQFGSAIGYVLLAIATRFDPTTMLVLVYASRVIDGFTGGNISTAQAYISDVTTPQQRSKGMAVIGVAFGLGFTAGPALGGILGHVNVSYPAYAAALFSAVAAVLTWVRLPETRVHSPTEAEMWLHPARFAPILKQPILTNLLLMSFVSQAAFVMMESTMVLFLDRVFHFGTWGTGWFFFFVGMVIILVQGGVVGRLSRKWGDWPLAILGPALVAAGMAGYVATAGWPALALLMLAGVLNSTGRSFQQPTVSSLISKHTSRDLQGAVFGLYHGLASLSRVAGPIVAAVAYKLWVAGAFATAGVLAAGCAVWTWIACRLSHRAHARGN